MFNEQTRSFTRYTKPNGLAGNIVSGMLEDKLGNIWMATFSGLSKFNPTQKTFRNYFTSEIQDVGTFHSHAFLKTGDGRFLFGGNGLLSFYPDSIREASPMPPLVFTGVSINGVPRSGDLLAGDTMEFLPSDKYITFEFATLDYRDNKQLQYAFRLEGLHSNWIQLGQERTCSFSGLPYGEYTLLIKGRNYDGAWSTSYLRVSIAVIPPFYRTWWFIILVAVFISVSASVLVRRRIHTIRKRALEERKLIEAELLALRLQINPHFFFNSLNAIQSFVMSNDEDLADKYISKFARLMRMVLESSRQQSVTIDSELEMLGLYLELEVIRFNRRFSYHINVEESVDTSLHIPSMLIQPYAENAVRHGIQPLESGGILSVSLAMQEDVLFCVVEDNGVGRERAHEMRLKNHSGHTSLGTSITSERFEVLNLLRKKGMTVRTIDLFDEEHRARGTRVEILIPVE